jgi:hypothetical protein
VAWDSTKWVTKSGVRRRRETSSAVRFNHSCVLNALLEMVEDALNEKWDSAYANLFASQQKALTFQARGIAASGELPSQTAYPSSKDFSWMLFLGVEPRSIGIVLAEGPCDLAGGGVNHFG